MTSTYLDSMNLELTEDGMLPRTRAATGETVWHAPLEIPPAPAGVDEDAWQTLHKGFTATYVNYRFYVGDKQMSVFEMTEAERIEWCAEAAAEWAADEAREGTRQSDRDRDAESIYYSGYGDRVGLDPFAYDSQGNDTGLRTSDFI